MRSKVIFGNPKPFGDIHSICPWANTPILVFIVLSRFKSSSCNSLCQNNLVSDKGLLHFIKVTCSSFQTEISDEAIVLDSVSCLTRHRNTYRSKTSFVLGAQCSSNLSTTVSNSLASASVKSQLTTLPLFARLILHLRQWPSNTV